MKILIDSRVIEGNFRGMGYFLKGILIELANIDSINEYILLVSNKQNISDLQLGENFSFYEANWPIGFVDIVVMPYLINYKIRPDIVWFPANNCSPFINKRIKIISTIHDIMFYTEQYKLFSKQYLGAVYRKMFSKIAINRADKINVVTKYNLSKISDFFKTDPAKFFYTYEDVAHDNEYDDSVFGKLLIGRKNYFYSITGLSPNKNFANLIKAYEKYCAEYGSSYKLVITGVNKERAGINNPNVLFTGYISDAQKNTLLKNCKLFLFLSKDEGFGIPPLEAIYQSCNILLTNIPNLMELYDGYVCFTKVDDVDTIVDDINASINNPVQYNIRLIRERFSWNKTAHIFLEEFNKLKK